MKEMSWKAKAFILGTVFFAAAFLVKPVGVSTQFSVVSGMIYNGVKSDLIVEDDTRESGYRSENAYIDKDGGKLVKSIKHPMNYDFIFVLAIPLGGFLGYQIRKRKVTEAKESEENQCTITKGKNEFARVYLPNFLGGFLLLYGARMAGGCTSGHMMSGMMQGAVSGYLFAGAVFLIAIPTAIIIGKRRGE